MSFVMLFSDEDECTTRTDICGGGNCTNLEGSYRCTCPAGLRSTTDERGCVGLCSNNQPMCRSSGHPPPLKYTSSEQWWLSGGQGGKLSGLFCAVLCATSVHSELHTHMNRTNSSLDWVLSHWAHFTVLRFIFAYIILCLTVRCMHVYCVVL